MIRSRAAVLRCTAAFFLAAFPASAPLHGAELLLCGTDEVFAIDGTTDENGAPKKVWSWKAKDHPEIPEPTRGAFGTTDECKPADRGSKVLISSSGGGCALVAKPSGKVLWSARVPNAHSLELLPHDRIIVASSVAKEGNRLILFNISDSDKIVWETPMPHAHGVVWDDAHDSLWALGANELRRYELAQWNSGNPSLQLKSTFAFSFKDGHDLQLAPGGNFLILTHEGGAVLVDADPRNTQPHLTGYQNLAATPDIKSISEHPSSFRIVFMKADEGRWWTDTVRLLAPPGELKFGKEKLYKARWLVTPAPDPPGHPAR